MREKVIDKLISVLNTEKFSSDELDKIKYGLEVIYIFITKTAFILTIAFFFNIAKEFLMLSLVYTPIRMKSGGVHASAGWICTISSIAYLLGTSYLIKVFDINYLLIIISLISVFVIYLYSPADTKKRPIVNIKFRKKLKIESTLLAILYIELGIYFNFTYLLYAVILQSIMINPISYKIFKVPYNNYLNYTKEVKL